MIIVRDQTSRVYVEYERFPPESWDELIAQSQVAAIPTTAPLPLAPTPTPITEPLEAPTRERVSLPLGIRVAASVALFLILLYASLTFVNSDGLAVLAALACAVPIAWLGRTS